MKPVDIIGAGPAGSAAAIAARELECPVRLFEKSVFPRHKVCGEFLSPEIGPALESRGLSHAFFQAGPARIGRVELHFRRCSKTWKLDEPAWGLSRYALDDLLFRRALALGAVPVRETWTADVHTAGNVVLARGRQASGQKGTRLFGFKAHFRGPASDAVELYFPQGGYAGINTVEGGLINVCGLASEAVLQEVGFDFDALLHRWQPLAGRARELERIGEWLVTGPLVFGGRFDVTEGAYPAGDALGFIDPFTGSGIAAALMTGTMAGIAAAHNLPVREHVRMCRQALNSQYATAGLLRAAVRTGLADWLAPLVPGRLLFHWTRPHHTRAA